MSSVIVLNADYTFLNTISWQEAVCLLVKGAAVPIDDVSENKAIEIVKIVRTVRDKYLVPMIIKLVKYVRTVFKRRVPWSKRNVCLSDRYICQYCGTKLKNSETTVDHIIPKSRGGKSTFENCVTACRKCNIKKNNRLPK